jgi:hypothetical protein
MADLVFLACLGDRVCLGDPSPHEGKISRDMISSDALCISTTDTCSSDGISIRDFDSVKAWKHGGRGVALGKAGTSCSELTSKRTKPKPE